MGWFNRRTGGPPEESRDMGYLPPGWRVPNTNSGTRVDEESSLKQGVVYAAVTLISDGVASLKPRAYQEDSEGHHQYIPVPTWIQKPHPEIRRYEIFNQLLVSALLWGNGYALIIRRPSDDQIIGLRPLDPVRVRVEWNPDRPGYRRYQINGSDAWLTSHDIFHLQGPTLPERPGGMSVIQHARESIGLGLTLEEFGARFFGQGAQHRVVIESPNNLNYEQARNLADNYMHAHSGPSNWHGVSVASGGSKIQTVTIPPNEAQFLDSRDFQGYEIARWFRVPPHRVGLVSKSTSWGSGLAEENLAMYQNTFRPWITRLEDALTAYTAYGQESGTRIELDTSEMLRGTFKELVTMAVELSSNDILNRTEARALIGYPSDGRSEFTGTGTDTQQPASIV